MLAVRGRRMLRMSESLFVVIPTAGNRPALLNQTLASLTTAKKPATYRKTIVVENGDGRRVEAMVGAFAGTLGASYRHEPRANKSGALNRVLAETNASLVVLLDDDVTVSADLLAAYAEAAQTHGRGRYFGGPLTVPSNADTGEIPAWFKAYLPTSVCGWAAPATDRADQLLFTGANWAAFARDLSAIGGFDERRGPGSASGGQETDAQLRLLAHGCRSVYVPRAKVDHLIEPALLEPAATLKRVYRNARSLGMLDAEGRNGTIQSRVFWRMKHRVRRLLWGGRVIWLCVQRLVKPNNEAVDFARRYWLQRRRGLIDGFRFARSAEGREGRPQAVAANRQ